MNKNKIKTSQLACTDRNINLLYDGLMNNLALPENNMQGLFDEETSLIGAIENILYGLMEDDISIGGDKILGNLDYLVE